MKWYFFLVLKPILLNTVKILFVIIKNMKQKICWNNQICW